MSDLTKAREENTKNLTANFSQLGENFLSGEESKNVEPTKVFINKISIIDEKIKVLNSKIEKIIYRNAPLNFQFLSLIGFYTVKIYSLIESIEPEYKSHSLLLAHLRRCTVLFDDAKKGDFFYE